MADNKESVSKAPKNQGTGYVEDSWEPVEPKMDRAMLLWEG